MVKKCVDCKARAVCRGLCGRCYTRRYRAKTLSRFKRTYKTKDENFRAMPNGCIEWTGDLTSGGYGSIQISSKPRRRIPAHRYFYEKKCGPIPKGMLVCHRCDNRRCINVSHLFIGTPADNARDAAKKNRMAVGKKHGGSKLTGKQVIAIRKSSKTNRALGAQYGVNHATIWEIKHHLIRVKEFIAGSNNGS